VPRVTSDDDLRVCVALAPSHSERTWRRFRPANQQVADEPEVPQLVSDVLAFKVRITPAGNDTYGSWREDSHDDLVPALALAAWYAERHGRPMVAHSHQG
jgi:hypothetical protein